MPRLRRPKQVYIFTLVGLLANGFEFQQRHPMTVDIGLSDQWVQGRRNDLDTPLNL